MKNTEDSEGGFAFPCSGSEGVNPESLGITLRDYFASKAMQGSCTGVTAATEPWYDKVAEHSYKMADAMISQKKKLNEH